MSFNEALALQKKQPRKIMVDFYTTWCGPCKLLDKNTFSNPDLVDYVNKTFYAVKFDCEGNEIVKYKDREFKNPDYKPNALRNSSHQFPASLNIFSYPTVAFFDEEGNPILPFSGYFQVPEMELILKYIQTDEYKRSQTQEQFDKWRESFVFEFKTN